LFRKCRPQEAGEGKTNKNPGGIQAKRRQPPLPPHAELLSWKNSQFFFSPRFSYSADTYISNVHVDISYIYSNTLVLVS
jgi:hypothetical protein